LKGHQALGKVQTPAVLRFRCARLSGVLVGLGGVGTELCFVSLYRTWRPRSFADLVGQDAVVRTLSTALSTGRLAHAYLFSGPRGSGKTSAAKILARCIECVNGPTATPDNTCENCVAILNGTALDVLEIDAASNRGIDEIRALRDAVKFSPANMRSKVYIIDEAHMLTKEGANAFLKTLEEPPEYAVFILATTAPEALPPTILSRCQRYAFRRIAIPTMIERMREISLAESISIDDAALGAIAYRADGGLRDALTMLEQVASFANGAVDLATVDAAFGTTGREYARALLDAALASDAASALRLIDDASDAGTDMAGLIRSLTAEFRHLLVGRVNPELLARDLSADDAAAALARAEATSQARIVRALRLLGESLTASRASGNARLELETALLRFMLAAEDPSLEALAARVAAIESGGGVSALPAVAAPPLPPARSAPAPAVAATRPPAARPAAPVAAAVSIAGAPEASAPEPMRATQAQETPFPEASAAERLPPETTSPVSAPGEVSLQKVRSLWQSVRTRVESEKPAMAGPLSSTMVEKLDGDTLTLRASSPPNAQLLRAQQALVQKALTDVLGRHLTLAIVQGPGAPPPTEDDGSPVDQNDLKLYALKRFS
jgi:DNA polymerase-3 subunit gamma/tau